MLQPLMFTKFVYELCERQQSNISHKNFRNKHRTSFSILLLIVSLLPECNQKSVRNVNKIVSVHQRECDWCADIKSQCILDDCKTCCNVCDIPKHF